MTLHTYAEGMEWLRAAGYGLLTGHDWDGRVDSVAYNVDGDSGGKTSLARVISHYLLGARQIVLIIEETGIWPSCENRDLFLRYRERVAGAGGVLDLPSHFASDGDIEYIEGLLALSLYFCWGVCLADSEGLIIRTSHDEWLEIASLDAARLAAAAEALDEFGLTRRIP